MASITIIVPTLNEAANIDQLMERLLAVRNSTNLTFSVLVVDSASPDGTGAKVLAWAKTSPVALLALQHNIGLAGAVLQAAHQAEGELVVVMDADLSHPPEKIPELLAPLLSQEHDMVIGSRYVKGGATPDWPWTRRLGSRLATLPALLFTDVKDPLAGFFALRRDYLLGLRGEVKGFKIALAVLAQYGAELRTKEIPIIFSDRDLGHSKMNKRVVFEYFLQLMGLALAKLLRR